jgi:nickel/cobalt transporter (NicO) family protein
MSFIRYKNIIHRVSLVIIFISLIFAFYTLNISTAHSHGVDSATYATVILPEEGKNILVSISFPWNVAIQIPGADLEKINPAEIDFATYGGEYERAIRKNLVITNNGELCEGRVVDIPKQSSDEILFGLGVMVNLEYDCSEELSIIVIENIFFVELPHHTNSVTVFKGSTDNLLQSNLLTPEVTSFTVGNVSTKDESDVSKNSTGVLSKLTSKLTTSSVPILMGVVFLLGFLHTLEAGHSKTILGGLMVNSKMSFKQAVMYALIFTATHIADIVILGIVLLLATSFVDIYAQLPYLQQFSLYALFFISLFLVLKSVGEYVKELIHRRKHKKDGDDIHHHNHDNNHSHDHEHLEYDEKKGLGQQLLMGFVAGLAPCIFGWSIFMAILSTKSVITLFPIIISFGLGIFLSLVLFAFIVWKLKKNIMKEGSIIASLSPIISALILLIYSLSQIV